MSLRYNVPRRSTTVNTSALDDTEWDGAVVIHLAVGMRASTLTIADGYKGWEEREGREEFKSGKVYISNDYQGFIQDFELGGENRMVAG